jgi:F-type H+-transporting ATPase subunit delta
MALTGLFARGFSQRLQAFEPSGRRSDRNAALHSRTVFDLADDSRNADVGARYAQALFELAEQGNALTAVEADLAGLKAAREESADLRRFLGSPAFTAEQKGRALTAIASAGGAHPTTLKFLGLLSANGRASALPAVVVAFQRLAADKRGSVAAEVVTALPLSAAQSKGVAAALRQALGKDPEITTRVDPSILGGMKVRVGSRLFDASVKSRLDSLKFALKRA